MAQLMNTINGTYNRCVTENVGISKHLIRELAASGTIPTVKAGRTILINYDVLMDFLNTGTVHHIAQRSGNAITPISEKLAFGK